MLGTKRGSPWDRPGGIDEVHRTFADLGLEALIVVGDLPSTSSLEAMEIMRSRRVGCLPVVEGNQLVGIVTSSIFSRRQPDSSRNILQPAPQGSFF